MPLVSGRRVSSQVVSAGRIFAFGTGVLRARKQRPVQMAACRQAVGRGRKPLRRASGLGILGASAIAVGALWFFTRAPVYLPLSAPPPYVVVAAQQMALSSGDAHPVLAYAIRTTEAMALTGSPSGHVAAPATPVYFVVLYGRFTANWASPPTGAATPTGTVVDFTINRKTHGVTDMSIGTQTPNLFALEAFGPLERFTVPPAGPAPAVRNMPSSIRSAAGAPTPAVVAEDVLAYVRAHTNVLVGLPPRVVIPTSDRWLWARLSVSRHTYLYTPPGYSVTYYATRHPYTAGTAPLRSRSLLQLTGNQMVRRLPNGTMRRLAYFWNSLPLGSGPGAPSVDMGPKVPVSLGGGLSAVRYPGWSDAIEWTEGSWAVVFQGNGTRSSGAKMAAAAGRLLRAEPLPPDPGLVVVTYSAPYLNTPATITVDLAWVRGGNLYTVNDISLPVSQVLQMVRTLAWSRP